MFWEKIDMWKLDETQKDEAVSLYKEGISCPKIGAFFGVSDTAIRGVLKRRGIKLRSNRDSHRKISLNETCFDEITEVSAYWIGFLMADGCISKRGNDSFTITLRLHKKDINHVKKFRTFLKTDAKILTIDGEQVQLAVKSTALANRLAEFSVIPRKSHTAFAPESLKNNVHFWRGVVDGDGSIGKYWIQRRKKHVVHFSVVGSKNLLMQLKQFIVSNNISSSANVIPHKSIFEYHLTGEFAVEAIGLIYSNSSIYLDRKFCRAKNISVLGWAVVNQPNEGETSITLASLHSQAPTL